MSYCWPLRMASTVDGASATVRRAFFVFGAPIAQPSSISWYAFMIRTDGVQFEADCDATPAQTDVGTLADLATNSTINPDASSNDLFYIESISSTVSPGKVLGHFVEGVPNS